MLLFHPAGGVMDRFGRRWVALPSVLILAAGLALLPLAHSFGTRTAVAVVLGIGNGIEAGLVMTLGADSAPPDARAQFLGGWRLTADLGNAAGPILIGAITLVAPLGVAAVVMGAGALGGIWPAAAVGSPVRPGHPGYARRRAHAARVTG
jgi:MFS family permease